METVKQQIEAEIRTWEKIHAEQVIYEAKPLSALLPPYAPSIALRIDGLKTALKIVESAIEREREYRQESAF